MPANDLDEVRRLISNVGSREFFKTVLDELGKYGLDDEDLISIISDELGEGHWFKSKITEKYFPGTTSDYFSIWVDECRCRMFLKLLIVSDANGKRVVVTSFKKDDRHV